MVHACKESVGRFRDWNYFHEALSFIGQELGNRKEIGQLEGRIYERGSVLT